MYIWQRSIFVPNNCFIEEILQIKPLTWILVTAFSPIKFLELNFYFVCSWFPPWQESSLIPPSPSSRWHVAPTESSGAAQAPRESDRLLSTAEGWPVLEEPFKEKIHARLNKNLVSSVSREQVKPDLTCNSGSQICTKYSQYKLH